MKKLLLLLFILLSLSATRPIDKNRKDILSSIKTEDPFMDAFLKYLKHYNMDKTMVSYEAELLEKKKLEGTDLASYKKYFKEVIMEDGAMGCVSRKLFKQFTKQFFTNSNEFKQYEKSLTGGKKGTRDYNVLKALASAGSPSLHGLEFILEGDYLTSERRYFYLYITLPNEICEDVSYGVMVGE